MSAESAASYIKFSNSAEALDLHHQNVKNKKQHKLIKFLVLVCIGMAMTLFLHEAYHWQKGCGSGSGRGGSDGRMADVEIKIIVEEVKQEPMDMGVITVISPDADDFDKSDSVSSEEEAAPEVIESCIPGSTKKMDCNTCKCNKNKNGFAWSCTKMGCMQLKNDKEPQPQVCTPGSVTMQDCNTCTCNEDGTGLGCTKMACNNVVKLDLGVDSIDDDMGKINGDEK